MSVRWSHYLQSHIKSKACLSFGSERSPAQTGLDFLKNGAGEIFILNTKALNACGLWATLG